MSVLTDRVSADLKAAMKEHRELELSVYRMLKAEIQKFHADKGLDYEVTDDDVITIVGRLAKQRREAAEQYKAVGAADRAQNELDECRVLEVYLPKQLSADEVEKVVRAAVAETGASGPRDMGKVMKAVMPKVKGAADGKLVKDTVMRVLQG
ncbi:MAG: GatB/YqeY domain-containing protein [Pyramidobacter sp.]|jgi:uncharacterized protein YqeY